MNKATEIVMESKAGQWFWNQVYVQKVSYEQQSMYVKYLKHFALVFKKGAIKSALKNETETKTNQTKHLKGAKLKSGWFVMLNGN